jgi:Flp pilus assembly protein TadG
MRRSTPLRRQRGSGAVEFAFVGILFVILLMTITGFGHWMYTLELVAEATRTGARVAVVCDLNDSKIRQVIQSRVPQLSLADSDISVQYFPAGCNKSNCVGVTVSLTGVSYSSWIPILPTAMPVPPFTTSLPRESMESVNAEGDINPVCY